MVGFIVGAIAGGMVAYLWRDSIRGYLTQGVPNLRDRAADTLEAVGKSADEFLDRAKSTVDANVRAGQQRLRHGPGASGGSVTEMGSRIGDDR
jgi:hypothetical protein